MTGSWTENFEVIFDEAKKVFSYPDTNSSTFGPLTLSFYNRFLAHIITTTVIPWKGSLSNVTCRYVFFLYYMIKKYKINWSFWIRKHMVKSADDSHASVSLPFGLPITLILIYYGIELSTYPVVEVFAIYDLKTFTSIGYVLIEKKWRKKSLSRTDLRHLR